MLILQKREGIGAGNALMKGLQTSGGSKRYESVITDGTYVYVGGKGFDSAISSNAYLGIMAKYQLDGTLVWQRNVYDGGFWNWIAEMKFTPSGDIALIMRGGSGSDSSVLLVDTDGVLQWEAGSYWDVSLDSIAVDSSGNVYAAGQYGGGGSDDYGGMLFKFSPTGTELMRKKVDYLQSLSYMRAKGLWFDSSGNYYMGLEIHDDYGIVKFDSSDDMVYEKRFAAPNTDLTDFMIYNDVVYALSEQGMLSKHSIADMSIDWIKQITPVDQHVWRGIHTDGTYIYTAGSVNDGGGYDAVAAVFDMNGNFQWSLKIEGTYQFEWGWDITSAANTVYLVGGMGAIPTVALMAKDGSSAGIYTGHGQTFTYSPITITTPTGAMLLYDYSWISYATENLSIDSAPVYTATSTHTEYTWS